MSIINLTENEMKFIDDFIDCFSSFNDEFYESADITILEKIISTLEKYGIKSGKFYNRIKSIIDKKKEENLKKDLCEFSSLVEIVANENKKNKIKVEYDK